MILKDHKAIVTGGASGIGAAGARTFAREGAQVCVLDIDDDRGAEIAAASGDGIAFRRCDVSDPNDVAEAMDWAAATMGGLSVLVHAAGIERGAPAEEITEKDWDLVLAVNAKSTMLANQAAFRHMKDRGGSIINFGSGGGIRGQRGSAHYAASKGAVMAWTRTVAQEWGRYGIRVNAVAPAAWTPMYDGYRARKTSNELAVEDMAMAHLIPIGGKLGDPDGDIAPVLVFLASDASRFITGQVLAVDGGLVMLGS